MPTDAVTSAPQVETSSIAATAHDRAAMFAPCILDRGRFSWVWIVPSCPYCHKSHDHYGGPLDGDPYRYIGRLFTARCDSRERRRLVLEYSAQNLWYILEPIQARERAPEPTTTRAVGRG